MIKQDNITITNKEVNKMETLTHKITYDLNQFNVLEMGTERKFVGDGKPSLQYPEGVDHVEFEGSATIEYKVIVKDNNLTIKADLLEVQYEYKRQDIKSGKILPEMRVCKYTRGAGPFNTITGLGNVAEPRVWVNIDKSCLNDMVGTNQIVNVEHIDIALNFGEYNRENGQVKQGAYIDVTLRRDED